MVTQLQPDVRAYLHGAEVIKRYIRVEEVAREYGLSVEETEYIAKAAGSLYKLTHIHLVKTKAVLVPMKAVRKLFVLMELHLDASIDKLDNLAMNVQIDKEKHKGNVKSVEQTEPERAEAERVEAEVVYSPMVAEPQEYQYNADAFENYLRDNAANDNKNKEIIMQKDKNVR
jgi:hypothetical protein